MGTSLDRVRDRLGAVRIFASPRRRFVAHLVVAVVIRLVGGDS
jgi:hypothetical protein